MSVSLVPVCLHAAVHAIHTINSLLSGCIISADEDIWIRKINVNIEPSASASAAVAACAAAATTTVARLVVEAVRVVITSTS